MRAWLQLCLLAAAVAGCAGPAAATDSKQDPLAAGRKLYVAKCAKCHKFYDPNKYSDADWAMWMEKMGKKARLKPEQKQLVSRYVDDTLRAPKKETPSTEPHP